MCFFSHQLECKLPQNQEHCYYFQNLNKYGHWGNFLVPNGVQELEKKGLSSLTDARIMGTENPKLWIGEFSKFAGYKNQFTNINYSRYFCNTRVKNDILRDIIYTSIKNKLYTKCAL